VKTKWGGGVTKVEISLPDRNCRTEFRAAVGSDLFIMLSTLMLDCVEGGSTLEEVVTLDTP